MDRTVDAVIIGMGYVGLPLAREASAAGLSVVGFDVNPEVVDGLNHGRSHVDDLADSDVVEMLGRGFFATTDAQPATPRPNDRGLRSHAPVERWGPLILGRFGLRLSRWPNICSRARW